jgi:hypothetical protein
MKQLSRQRVWEEGEAATAGKLSLGNFKYFSCHDKQSFEDLPNDFAFCAISLFSKWETCHGKKNLDGGLGRPRINYAL